MGYEWSSHHLGSRTGDQLHFLRWWLYRPNIFVSKKRGSPSQLYTSRVNACNGTGLLHPDGDSSHTMIDGYSLRNCRG
jgi:hypothetical protein